MCIKFFFIGLAGVVVSELTINPEPKTFCHLFCQTGIQKLVLHVI